ncbi:MAG: DUF2461 domain-containing protein [Pseudomonadota bacterium]|nr:DUF2461 domain-containing protein [Pseudomonadota bacterium]
MGSFSPALFEFLTELAAHNDREWFTANKGRFERDVKAPLHAFVAALAPRLALVDPEAVCTDKSVFRIYRDTRFGANKAPYKTHAGLQFPRGADKGPSATGYYLHLDPAGSFFTGGLWQPEPAVAAKIRAAIDTHAPSWVAIRDALGGLDAGESLVRTPKGFAADHPLADDLRRKGFTASTRLTEAEVCGDDFVERVARACQRLQPLVGFLGEAVGAS